MTAPGPPPFAAGGGDGGGGGRERLFRKPAAQKGDNECANLRVGSWELIPSVCCNILFKLSITS